MPAISDVAPTSDIPVLEGQSAEAVSYRGSHMQIIASAGSGKTETVSQRVAVLVAEGVDPANIVAFTFTEKAAAELFDQKLFAEPPAREDCDICFLRLPLTNDEVNYMTCCGK